MRPLIDYRLLSEAMTYYEDKGWEPVEVPWMVSPSACFATLDPQNSDAAFAVRDQYLVGSAEQGFIELDLSPGRYVACSPCFRAGDTAALHWETFMKVELHQSDDVSEQALSQMIYEAQTFFYCLTGGAIERVCTSEGTDLFISGVEVGSYGRRQYANRSWLYGTGLALPRLTSI